MTDHGDADDDDPQLGGLRSIWLAMPDEDPPARGLAELMAAARVKAEEMAAPSLWQRIVATMRRPPALALATVMVLVAGVVLVGNRRDKLDAPSPASEELAQGSAADESTIAPAPAAMDPGAAPAVEAPSPVEAKPDVVASGAERPRSEPKKKAANKGMPPAAKPIKSARGELFEGMADEPAKQQAADERRDMKVEADAKPTLEIAKPEAPPPEERELGAAQVTASATADSGGAAKTTRPTGVAQLHTQARSAAARKDCSTVKVLAQKIAKQDPAYYRANVANDAAITTCIGTAALQ